MHNHQSLKRKNGFTLIEILIGLVVVALLASLSVVAFSDKRKEELEEQSYRLYALLSQVKDETLLRGIDIGLRLEEQKYLFYVYDLENEKWLPLTDDELFREREIPEILELKVVVDGNTIFSEDDAEDVDIFEKDVDIFEEEEEKIEPPQIYVLSSGEMNDFKIALGWIDEDPKYYLISGNVLGELELEGPLSGNMRDEVNDNSLLNFE
ncbi:type II secretion system minor pseudopilin GspH [Pleionea sediminis]|uniref:type II secretion system minor pseudopilin GspH n=1 Tax=Pleionea sediminis TaxID=2569479 RepID=UPI001185A71F|nr:type II secretion system minor pseudopilin GspH [Pleionea sediminis]